MSGKEILGFLSVLTCLAAYVFYIYEIVTRKIKPHMFSWIIWAITEGTAFTAQFVNAAGPGSWASGCTSLSCMLVAVISLFYGDRNITRNDWTCFIFALTAIPLWYFTSNALLALLLLIGMDLTGFYLTAGKAWRRPREENATLYLLSSVRCFISLFALENVSVVTAIYPIALLCANSLVGVVVLWRRKLERV